MRLRTSSSTRLRISSRKSDLARIQAYAVGEALRRAHPTLEVEYRFKESLGDVNQEDPLWKMPERGVFTNDFLRDLIAGETDLVVHSWKDLPTEDRPETEIAGTLPRADARDLLILKQDAWPRVAAGGRLRVFSSSPRRAYNLEPFLREHLPASIQGVEFISVRGNVPTRIRKLFGDTEVDALIVAKAALDRLLEAGRKEGPEEEAFASGAREIRGWLDRCRFMVLPLSLNPTAAAQGALAIEIRAGRTDLKELLASIHCATTARTVQREREVLKGYGGGCHQKIGVNVLAREYGEITYLRGLTDAGEVLSKERLEPFGKTEDPARLERAKCWPLPEERASRQTERHPLVHDPLILRSRALWIARDEALPSGFAPDASQLVWTAGLETWRKLAKRGVWVNGSSEGLGDGEDPRLQELCGRVDWLKLTHADSRSEGMPHLATYEVVQTQPDLAGRDHFFWMSGSSFLRALEAYPWLKDRQHFCGPGSTYWTLRETLGHQAKVFVQLSYSQWLETRVKG